MLPIEGLRVLDDEMISFRYVHITAHNVASHCKLDHLAKHQSNKYFKIIEM